MAHLRDIDYPHDLDDPLPPDVGHQLTQHCVIDVLHLDLEPDNMSRFNGPATTFMLVA